MEIEKENGGSCFRIVDRSVCPYCQSDKIVKNGKTGNRKQRYSSSGFTFDPSIGYSEMILLTEVVTSMMVKAPTDGKGEKVNYNNETVRKFAMKYFRLLKNAKGIFANKSVPSSCKYDDTTGKIITDKGEAYGVTMRFGFRSSRVYIGEAACETSGMLFITLQHELTHVGLNYLGYGDNRYSNAQEVAAWEVTKRQVEAWGYDKQFAVDMQNQYRQYLPLYSPNLQLNVDYSRTIRNTEPEW